MNFFDKTDEHLSGISCLFWTCVIGVIAALFFCYYLI